MRRLMAGAALLATALASQPGRDGAHAEDVSVPIALQAELLAKVAAYDRNLPARAGEKVEVLILTKGGDDESTRAARTMKKALAGQETIAGLAHEEVIAQHSDAAALAATCKSKRVSIVYVTPGFTDDEIVSIAKALDGADVLTGAALPSFVPKGIVVGFDLVSGKPKLLVHLAQARRQHVALSAEILKLMKVYE